MGEFEVAVIQNDVCHFRMWQERELRLDDDVASGRMPEMNVATGVAESKMAAPEPR